MYLSEEWKDYVVLDCGGGEKYERWGDVTLLRPDPQAIWPMDRPRAVDAHYMRSSGGGGNWEFYRNLPEKWQVHWRDLSFVVRPTGFKHTGLFPEQAVNWAWMQERIAAHQQRCGRLAQTGASESTRAPSSETEATGSAPPLEAVSPRTVSTKVLNLFGYTGGATVACLAAGAELVHVDAAKGMVAWAKENAAANGLSDRPVRWIVDDALKFVRREQRRGHSYDGILMDPPSYGRGPSGEMWRLEDSVYELIEACEPILSEEPAFFLINSYTTGLGATVLGNMLRLILKERRGGHVEAAEIGLPVANRDILLPCGTSGRWTPYE